MQTFFFLYSFLKNVMSEIMLKNETPKIIVLWASSTGRAKSCARRACRLIRSHGVPITSCCSFDDFGSSALLNIGRNVVDKDSTSTSPLSSSSVLLVLFVSTTGDGEQCDSMKECWLAL